MINSINTKNSAAGDRVYLQTVFPIISNGKIVIPPGSYVEGTVTEVKRPGRVKGRGFLYVRFDSLILPNGVTRDFRARVGSLDGRGDEKLEKGEGKIQSESGKSNDVKTAAVTGVSGGLIGAGLGAEVGHMGEGAAIGGGAGLAAGVMPGPSYPQAGGYPAERQYHRNGARPAAHVQLDRDQFPGQPYADQLR